jgi:antitoxin VapB
MALHIRDERAQLLAKKLARRRGVTMTQAVVDALETALARDARPLAERLRAIAEEAARLGDPKRRRKVKKQDIDALWDNG